MALSPAASSPGALLDWLFAQQERGVHPGLGRMRALLAALGHPERGLSVVQVGGTNGKGSTTRMVASMLQAAGWGPVGEYTSPHLHRLNERVRVDGLDIPDEAITRHVARLQAAHAEVPATFFELLTALALLHFAERGVRWAVLEVGLGGRLDATTAVPSELSLITTVALDHTAILGTTVEAIAAEKAGILRPGVPALTGAQGPALEVARVRALEVGAPLWVLGESIGLTVTDEGLEGLRVRVDTPTGSLEARTPLPGLHQGRNAALAVAAGLRLGLPSAAIRTGLEAARWPGRLEFVPGTPPVLLDAAHNPEGAEALARFVSTHVKSPVTLVVGGLADKDLAGVARQLRSIASAVVVTRPAAAARAASLEALAALYPGATLAPTVAVALELARDLTALRGLVLVAGTIPLVAEAREHLLGLEPEGRLRFQ